jgi:hypothetical protein
MVRGTARSKLIGNSYREFSSPSYQGATFAPRITPGGGPPAGSCQRPKIRSNPCADAMQPLPARST